MKSHASNVKSKKKENKDGYADHSVIDALELPKDIFLGLPLLAFEGNRTLCITNHRGLVSYGHNRIIVAAKGCSIQILGRELVIPRFNGDLIEIRGYLEGVTFL